MPATIYSTGEDIVVTPPPGGYTLDAVATDGRITIDDGDAEADRERDRAARHRAGHGGGPTLTLRATRAEINVRSRPK